MSYCLYPACPSPINPLTAHYCQSCGMALGLVNQYHVIKMIGSGGFGRTFLAQDLAYQRLCVIKQLRAISSFQRSASSQNASSHQNDFSSQYLSSCQPMSGFSAADLDRFRQETQRLDELGHHPQIPQLWNTIEHPINPFPALYIVQEFMAGDTLEDDLNNHGPWTESKVRSLLASILPVLQFIHDHHVIHRDIKPQNIICPHQNNPFVLVDFGAAKRTSQTQMAHTGTMIGSAGYAAPEQTMGKAIFASDLYSLGVTCIHLLTGMHPFELYCISQDDWVWQQYLLTPVSPTLTHILNTLLRRSINQRYRTATAVLADLSAAIVSPSHPSSSRSSRCSNVFKRFLALPWQTSTTSSEASNIDSNTPALSPLSPSWQQFSRTPLFSTTSVHSSVASPAAASVFAASPASPISRVSAQYLSTYLSYTFSYHRCAVTALAMSFDNTLSASGDRSGTILLWDLASGTLLQTFSSRTLWQRMGHRDRITALQFTSDGTTLISSSADGTIKQWDLIQHKLLTTLTGEGWVFSSLALHPDGEFLVSGAANGAIDLWDLNQQRFIQRMWTHTNQISGLVIAANGHTLVSSSYDGTLVAWDLRTAEAIAFIRAHYQGVYALALHPNSQQVISGGGDRTVRLWTLPQFRPIQTLEIEIDPVISLAFHPNGQLLATPRDETHIQLWNLQSAQDFQDADIQRNSSNHSKILDEEYFQRIDYLSQDWDLTGILFSPKGDRLISSSQDGTIKVWRSSTAE